MSHQEVIKDFRLFAVNTRASITPQISINKSLVTDFLIKYEGLKAGIEHVSKVLDCDVDLTLLPKFKSEFRDRRFTLKELYDRKTISVVKENHHDDLCLGDYSFPS